MVAEIFGGIISGSLAILTDAAHMCSDVVGFAVSIAGVFISFKSPNSRLTYGYHRAEVLGAMVSIMIIWIMIVFLCVEATVRIMHPENINIESEVMIITSFLSLGCNLFNLFALTDIPCLQFC